MIIVDEVVVGAELLTSQIAGSSPDRPNPKPSRVPLETVIESKSQSVIMLQMSTALYRKKNTSNTPDISGSDAVRGDLVPLGGK